MCCIRPELRDPEQRMAMMDDEIEVMSVIQEAIFDHMFPIVAVGDGEGSLPKRMTSISHSLRLECYGNRMCLDFIGKMRYVVSDQGIEHSCSLIKPIALAKMLPWFNDSPAESPSTTRSKVQIVEGDFSKPPVPCGDAVHARVAAADADALLDFSASAPIDGLHHQIHGAISTLPSSLKLWDVQTPKLVRMAGFFSSKGRRQKVMERNYTNRGHIGMQMAKKITLKK